MTIRLRLILGFLIIIAAFVVVLFVNLRLSNEVQTNTSYLSSSEIVIRKSNILHKEMIEMQSSFRGFLLTELENFLGPYYEGIKSVPELSSELRSLLSTERQKEKLDSIILIHKEWIEYSDSLIASKKDTLPESNIRYKRLFNKKLRMEVGKNLNDQIRKMFFSLDDYEYDLRFGRRKILQESIENTRFVTLSLTIAVILFSLIASMYFIRIISERISNLVKFAEQIATGDFINITDRKNDELAKLVDSLNNMSSTLDKNFNELKKKNSELDQFAYVVSHDLKAPLRGINNIISWIEEDHGTDIDPDIAKNIKLIKGRAERLEKMINGLLDYARVERTKKGIESVNVGNLLSEIKDLIVPRNVTMVTDEELPIIRTEKLHLEQVFTNLIDNAIKYNTSSSPKILIKYSSKGKFHEFSIIDNGPGIEERYFDKIFVIFQTLQERDAFESTGVGLAIVKKIIEDHKGTIDVKSTLGKGTTFRFTWPKNETEK